MPKASSAARQARSSLRKRLRNRAATSRIKSGLVRFQSLLKEDPKAAKEHGQKVISWLDKAGKTGVFHVNKTRRYKSRIVSKIQALK